MGSLSMSVVTELITQSALSAAAQNNVTVGVPPEHIESAASSMEEHAALLRSKPEKVHGVFTVIIYTAEDDGDEGLSVGGICLGSRAGHIGAIGVLQQRLEDAEKENGGDDGDASEE